MADKDPFHNTLDGFFWGAVAGVVLSIIIAACNGCTPEASIVRHGGAHYEMDPATGRSTFHWNDEKK